MTREILVIAGPTASGKTELSIKKALEYNGELINCDSLQVYSDLKLLTAFPSKEELSMVPHRMFGYLNYDKCSTAVEWAQKACEEIEDVFAKNKLPIIVGGTGMYLEILKNGISPIPNIESDIRQKVLKIPFEKLCEKSKKINPELNLTMNRQITKAMEIYFQTGKPLKYFYNLPKIKFIENVNFKTNLIETNRETLYNKINLRFEIMLKSGAIEEVQNLLNKIDNPDREFIFNHYPIFNAIGAKEITLLLDGVYNYEQMKTLAQTRSRQYAKRQLTWLRKFY